jgi:hypothetical protein
VHHYRCGSWIEILILLCGDIEVNPGPKPNHHYPSSKTTRNCKNLIYVSKVEPSSNLNEIPSPIQSLGLCKQAFHTNKSSKQARCLLHVLPDEAYIYNQPANNSLNRSSLNRSNRLINCFYPKHSAVKQLESEIYTPPKYNETRPRPVTSINRNNLIKIQTERLVVGGLINCRSIHDKADDLRDVISHYDLDYLALTETWLKPDTAKLGIASNNICNPGYSFLHEPRQNLKRGGGVGFVFRNILKHKKLKHNPQSPLNIWCFLQWRVVSL